MAHEVDFLAVGENGCSGDAIALRFGTLTSPNEQAVVVLDGGFAASGKALAEHIRKHYRTTVVDLVINTHPDGDHSSGLKVVLEELTVRQLWMHQPWKHAAGMAGLFKDGRVTDTSVRESLRRSLDDALDLERLANRKKIPITEPFAGVNASGFGATIEVLGPTIEYYESLLPHFRGTPEPAVAQDSVLRKLLSGAQEVVSRVAESWGIETLGDGGETTPENNSSAIVLVSVGGRNLLFTGDAGVPALTAAVGRLESRGFDLRTLTFVQVPHHGSHRNVGRALLDRMLGPRLPADNPTRTGFVSAAKGDPKHPSKKVLNAFRRRGLAIHGTDSGHHKRHHHEAPTREGWVASVPHPFYPEVEE